MRRRCWRSGANCARRGLLEDLHSALDVASQRATLPAALSPDLPDDLPEGPGVYRFFGLQEGGLGEDSRETLLYVGKANILRERVLDHFRGRRQRHQIVESRRPGSARGVDRNGGRAGRAAARSARGARVRSPGTTARRVAAGSGSPGCSTTARPRRASLTRPPTCCARAYAFGTYRAARDARRALEGLAREHQWCFKLLGLESGEGSCFGLQVGRCKGACVGKEPAPLHMARVKVGLMPLKLKPWPHEGPVVLREGAGERQQWHIIDAWQHLATIDADCELERLADLVPAARRGPRTFDIDSYRIITRFMRDSRYPPRPLPRT